MRARLIRLLVFTAAITALGAVLAAQAGAASGVRLIRIRGLPRVFVQSQTLSFSLTARSRRSSDSSPALGAWIQGGGAITRLRLAPNRLPLAAGQRVAFPLAVGIPDELAAGRYGLIVCAADRRLDKLPAQGCVRSNRFSLIRSVRITTGQGSTARVTLDPSRAVSATIGSAGGRLSSTAADGSRLKLTIPAGALAGGEQIRMTPILKLTNAGLALVAGAQLGPDGLRLQQPAKLAVTPAHPVRLAAQTGFSYQGTGSQFGLLALAPGRSIEIPLLRLGGAGLGSARGAQLSARQDPAPRDPLAAFLQQLANPLRQLRLGQLHLHPSGTSDPVTEAKGELGGYYNQYVEPALRRAGGSLGGFLNAAQRTLAWVRETDLLGYPKPFVQQRHAESTLLANALLKIWGKRTSACASGATVGKLQAVLTLGKLAQALALDSVIGGSSAIISAAQTCAQITGQASIQIPSAGWQAADFDSQLSQIVSTVAANGPLTVTSSAGENAFSFQSPHVAVSEQVTAATASAALQTAGCSPPTFVSYSSDPSQMYATFSGQLTVPDDLFDVARPPWTFALGFAGADTANWSITCPGSPQPTSFTQSPGAMAGLGGVSGVSPIMLTASKTSRSFSGSVDLISGQSIGAFASAHGRVVLSLPN